MTRPPSQFRDDARFRIMRLLEDHPQMTQRDIADALGISLGGVNYCLRGLVERGNVKVQNFRASTNKRGYAYVLTPKGLQSRAALARDFLERRMAEYQALHDEIEALAAELGDVQGKS
jgi:EPS-associated MarR family transcriptional regulator